MTESLITFLHANHFAVAFREVLETSVAHIYLSALPSVPKTSKNSGGLLAKISFSNKDKLKVIQQQRTPLLELRGPTGNIFSVGFSSHRVRPSGLVGVMEPLKGHTDIVTSVSFCPDGTPIVPGSVDKTIRIWDAKTGEYVMKPHTSDVSSVCFSPDGTRIVSRSGEEVMKPLRDVLTAWLLCQWDSHCVRDHRSMGLDDRRS